MAECSRRPYTAPQMTSPAIPDDHWDAGDLGCGDLVGTEPRVLEPLHYQTTIDGSRAPWGPK
jgi:hypothetical protein